MRVFMESGPSVTDYPSYKSLNDAVGAVHGLPAGKCQALAGEKAWAWYADTVAGTWRPATEQEVEAKRAAAAGKNHGGPRSKVLSDADRAALDAQIEALRAVDNPTLRPLLTSLYEKQWADDAARRGSLKDRLQAAIDKLGLQAAVDLLEAAAAETPEA
jgi:hypothetical protein